MKSNIHHVNSFAHKTHHFLLTNKPASVYPRSTTTPNPTINSWHFYILNISQCGAILWLDRTTPSLAGLLSNGIDSKQTKDQIKENQCKSILTTRWYIDARFRLIRRCKFTSPTTRMDFHIRTTSSISFSKSKSYYTRF